MLRCGPSDQTFAATAALRAGGFTQCGTNRTCAGAAIACAENVRICSVAYLALQHISPNRHFERIDLGKSQTGLSLRLVPAIKKRTFLLFAPPQAVTTPGYKPLFGFSIRQRTQCEFARLIKASFRLKTHKTAVPLEIAN